MAGRLRELEARLQQLSGEKANLLAHIGAAVTHAAGGTPAWRSGQLGPPEAQVAALSTLAEARGYVALLKDCTDAVRELEGRVYAAESLPAEDWEGAARAASAAAEAYADAFSRRAALDEAAAAADGAEGLPPSLRGCGEELSRRLAACRDRLRGALAARIDARLAECGWPPQIVPPGGGGAAAAPGPPGAPPAAAAAAAGAAGDAGAGLQFASPERAESVAALQRLMLALTRLQRADDAAAFEAFERSSLPLAAMAGDSAPMLWAAQQLAAPIASELRRQFGPGAPAGRLDKPEWLLCCVLRLARELGPHLDFLQAVVEASDLHGQYHIAAEFARALREAAMGLLRDATLPALAAAGDRGLWLAWVDGLTDFEIRMAAPLGVSSALALARGDVPLPLLRHSTLSVIGERQEWMDSWLAAESAAASKAVEGILFSPSSWERAPSLKAVEDRPAWRCEFYPPAAAEALAALVTGQLMPRVQHIPQPEAQDRYLGALAVEVLGGAHANVVRMLRGADTRDPKAVPLWAPRVGACVCFLHFLEHAVGEMAGALTELLKSRTDPTELAAAAAAAGDGQPQQQQQPGPSGTPAPQPWQPGPQQQQQQQQQQFLPGAPGIPAGPPQQQPFDPAAAGGPGGASSAASSAAGAPAASAAARQLLAGPLSEYAASRKEWTLRIAKAVAQGFLQQAQGYLGATAAFKDADAPATPDAVSPALADALVWLQSALAALSRELDRDCFRDALRAAAAALNAALFNGPATEAAFGRGGAAQFGVDVGALLRVFQPYCWKSPRGHFPELLDALALLNLREQGQVEVVRQAVAPETRAANAVDVLRSVGVRTLDPDQADCVLSRRAW
ncbi:hypothetical protein Rsub_02368 [Raphidocelis subcapitata]|uniref:Uncharacterized protein n=1 Tax=Raphidocelis subcapitata TaxID=307507 RepID=A0A2V0NVQ5_9CHLO|nr:hypothetical protein Rsub_02368 [Raphidocelis subcapitata]|eukprot:GBF89650.1 hypothetical protein Rsub_02368 [Raphidocelis subcapitata]